MGFYLTWSHITEKWSHIIITEKQIMLEFRRQGMHRPPNSEARDQTYGFHFVDRNYYYYSQLI